MRKSKYDTMQLSPQTDGNDGCNDKIEVIENRIEHSAEIAALTEQTKTLKQLIVELQKLQAYGECTMDEYRKSTKAFNAAVQSSDNIVNGICRSITRAEKSVITVKLSKEEKDELASHRQKLIEEEKKLLEEQVMEIRKVQESHWKDVRNYIKAESGFYLTGKIAKLALYTFWGLYAYFCITLGIMIICRLLH